MRTTEQQKFGALIKSQRLIRLQADQFNNIGPCNEDNELNSIYHKNKYEHIPAGNVHLRKPCNAPASSSHCFSAYLSLDDAITARQCAFESNLSLGPDMTLKQQERQLMSANCNLRVKVKQSEEAF